jgi:hypothetical protein
MVAGWSGQQVHTGTVLVLADADLPPGLLAYLEEPERLATGTGQAADHSRVTLTLWRAHVRDAAGHVAIAPLTLPTPTTPPTPPARSARSARPAPPTPSARPPRSAP